MQHALKALILWSLIALAI